MTIVSGLVLLSTTLPTYLPVCQPGQILLFFRDKNFFLPCQEQNGSIPLKALSCIYSTCTEFYEKLLWSVNTTCLFIVDCLQVFVGFFF